MPQPKTVFALPCRNMNVTSTLCQVFGQRRRRVIRPSLRFQRLLNFEEREMLRSPRMKLITLNPLSNISHRFDEISALEMTIQMCCTRCKTRIYQSGAASNELCRPRADYTHTAVLTKRGREMLRTRDNLGHQ